MSAELVEITWPEASPPDELATLAWGIPEAAVACALLSVTWRVAGRDIERAELRFVDGRLQAIRLHFEGGLGPDEAVLLARGFERGDEGFWTMRSETTVTEIDTLDGHATLTESF